MITMYGWIMERNSTKVSLASFFFLQQDKFLRQPVQVIRELYGEMKTRANTMENKQADRQTDRNKPTRRH